MPANHGIAEVAIKQRGHGGMGQESTSLGWRKWLLGSVVVWSIRRLRRRRLDGARARASQAGLGLASAFRATRVERHGRCGSADPAR
jgi:hypothetical protein